MARVLYPMTNAGHVQVRTPSLLTRNAAQAFVVSKLQPETNSLFSTYPCHLTETHAGCFAGLSSTNTWASFGS